MRITRGYALGRHPVTNATYGEFLEATRRRPPDYWNDRRFNEPDRPVVGVSWADAQEFCAWLSVKLGGAWKVELPTEAQWELAARGTDGRRYPWGPEAPTAERAVFGLAFDKGSPAAVGGRPAGASWCGAEDMAGNVREWCRDCWSVTYATWASRGDNPCRMGESGWPRVVRGGSWVYPAWFLRAARRLRVVPGSRGPGLGFRVVCRGFPEPVGP